MTFETTVVLIALVGIVVAVGAHAYGISSWRLFTFGCVPAAVVLALAVWEIGRPCDHHGVSKALGVLFLIGLLASLTLYAAAAVAGVIEGVRSGKAGSHGNAFASFVVCPLVCVLGGGLVLFAALATALHCYES
jgi:uncharacterized membrane protein YjgN (DUF898 family)